MNPVDLLPYRDYHWSRVHNRMGPEEWDRLRDEIERDGFRSPAGLAYNHKTGTAYLGEGNHRLGIARELHRALPVVVFRSAETAPDSAMTPLTEPGEYTQWDSMGFGRFPELASPSDIGLTVVRGERDFIVVAPGPSAAADRDGGIARSSDSGFGL
jgi:hypothetical protein